MTSDRGVPTWRSSLIMLLPIAAFGLSTVWAIASSPALHTPPAQPAVVPEAAQAARAVAGVQLGSWEAEPTCIHDPRGDVETFDPNPANEDGMVGGPGDLVSACALYGDVLTVEARMAEPVVRLPDGEDEAELVVGVAADEDSSAGLSVTVARLSEDRVAQIEDLPGSAPPSHCVGASAWQQHLVRVVVEAACIDEPSRLVVSLRLVHYDPYDFVSFTDYVSDLRLNVERTSDPTS